MRLYEKYRPRTLRDVVGHEKQVRRLQAILKRGRHAGRAFWISGQSGTGKTTIARILAASLAEPHAIQEIDGGEATASWWREVGDTWSQRSIGEAKSGRAYIVNEAHRMRADAISAANVALERQPDHVVVVFTTSVASGRIFEEEKMDSGMLLSRCVRVALSRRDLAAPFAARVHEIAECEGLNGQPKERYLKLARDCGNNLRAMLSAVDSLELL